MFIIRVDPRKDGREQVTLWLKTASPVRFDERSHALRFATKGEARRVAREAKLVGWTVEEL